jgi:hypothetical protein
MIVVCTHKYSIQHAYKHIFYTKTAVTATTPPPQTKQASKQTNNNNKQQQKKPHG